ncbi:Putative beta-glucosidase 23 [Dendrobium catenatum]|uniref:Beta-glucosidase 23 n=1 Tax=Dendrobium catenatum TaxID=906689 RepID=A0A2I0VZY4_9ASPA|nr:Putative beta-glucosidase 23 [Dendrobium catenatum]
MAADKDPSVRFGQLPLTKYTRDLDDPRRRNHGILIGSIIHSPTVRFKCKMIKQKGQIGINIYTMWFKPLTNSTEDAMATKRARDFLLGWILNPILFGDYPEIIKKNAGSRLPSFSYSESQKVKGSFDFIGINYYFAFYVADDPSIPKTGLRDYNSDMFAKFTGYGLGVVDTINEINDVGRITFLSGFIGSVLDSIRDGIDVRGYFIWTFVDGYELISGYSSRFGLYHVNFEDSEHERTPKLSAHWITFLGDAILTIRQCYTCYCTEVTTMDGLGSLVRIQTLQASFHIK